jgi:hypothetical protein
MIKGIAAFTRENFEQQILGLIDPTRTLDFQND